MGEFLATVWPLFTHYVAVPMVTAVWIACLVKSFKGERREDK